MLVHAWSSAGALRRPFALRSLVGAAGLVLVLGVLRVQAPTVEIMRSLGTARTAAGDAVMQGLVDQSALRAIDDDPAQMREMLPSLRERGLGVFADSEARRLGRPLTEAGPVGALPCPGSLDVARADPALGPDGVALAGRILLADADGRIVGLGEAGRGGAAWTGCARARPGAEIRAFLRLRWGRLCGLDAARVVSPAEAGMR